MIEDKTISTETRVSTTQNAIDIFIYYVDKLAKKLNFFISESNKTIDGILFKQGDLGYTYENTSEIFSKDENGNLVVVSEESNKYEINGQGQLTFTE